MNRKLFLTVASIIALGVGAMALMQPALLLESKGIELNAPANVWMRETGVALVSVGVVALLLRGQPDSPALRAFLMGATLMQVGLLSIELSAFADGVITKLSGVLPNSVLHVVLGFGFAYFALKVRTPARPGGSGD